MSSFGLLNLGTQSLQANQTALSVTGQNISNVNTEGYTRQRPVFQSREGVSGVVINDIDRIADAFLNKQIWGDSAGYNSSLTFEAFANELDNLMAGEATSISTAMDNYFGALQTAVDDPVSLPNRELFIAQAEALVQRFNDLDANIRRQNDTINGRLESSVAAINTISSHIAELNDDIRIAQASGSVPSELLDQRDAQLEELSKYISFTTLDQPSGEVSVFIGNGQPLVVGLRPSPLTTVLSPADSSQLNIAISINGNISDISNQVSGGQVGGLLEYRDKVLNKTLDELGRIALVFADGMNEQHQLGMDFDGNAGGLLFTDINSATARTNRFLSERDNASSATGGVTINDVSKVLATEYELIFNSDSNFTLIRKSDGMRWNQSTLTPTAPPTDDGQFSLNSATGELSLRIDGFTLDIDTSPAFVVGDKYLIRPARNAASEIDTVISSAQQLALAAPLAVSENIANTGTGTVSVAITDKDYADLSSVLGELTPPLELSFTADASGVLSYVLTDADGDTTTGLYQPGEPIALQGYEIVIRNLPSVSDRFTIDLNTGGVSDNRNALLLSDLQFAKSISGASYQDKYGQVVERVGTQASVAQLNSQSSKSVLDINKETRAAISGVNLDEEAAKLVQFQQAYQASAQLIRAAQTIFDTLLQSV
ncbi:flagellar hook-associated protein FlgK [Neptuniibacter sp. CAU 1671]|uniref:flagellar hook-associated protein FlgK n=1 Tax=Neptuniibacter sp. CAU 1671 TaxID=3032593 RepID=UPI0023DBE57A|nr:flagellar hook-associated protein FlgK [Neptuniibacter sp. CAU 1671]MDF2181826.1 flagellar hook-associated protein FlgK [Neptuniibacter sp. CAU 1671]